MKRSNRLTIVSILAVLMFLQMMAFAGPSVAQVTSNNDQASSDDAIPIQAGPNEELQTFSISDQGFSEWSGTSATLDGGEYANRSDTFVDNQITYLPANTTTNATVQVPTGTDWEIYEVEAEITGLTENRTWIVNEGLDVDANWTWATHNEPSPFPNAVDDGTQTSEWDSTGFNGGDESTFFEMTGYEYDDRDYGGTLYGDWYDVGDKAYAVQNITVDRGEVEWVGVSLDYWANCAGWSTYMTGFFELFVSVGDPDNGGTYLWSKQFDAIDDDNVWYSTGLVELDPGVLNLPNLSIWIGLRTTQLEWYRSVDIIPQGRLDNIVIYMKTKASPENVNLEMNGEPVLNGAAYGLGSLIQTPAIAWGTNPVLLNFTWTPTPVNPSPNREIRVDFDVTTNSFARRTVAKTVHEINPGSHGEIFTIQNGTDATYTSYFYANIPDGYVNRYFFNVSLPTNRDVFFVARPLAPSTNMTTGLTGGNIGDGYLNVSAYEIATESGRFGYWRIKSNSTNMISDIQFYDPATSSYSRNVDFRAGNSSDVQVFVGPTYHNSIVNITIFDPSGAKWHSENAVVNSSGYAVSTQFNLAGSNSPAGEWMVQATTNDVGAVGKWTSTGFFRRAFTVTHASNLVITHPTDAVGSWLTNVTYGDLLLVVTEANDTDSDVLVPGGTLEVTWALGVDTFDDTGTGQYTKVFDTSLLPGKGQYIMDLNWSHPSYDEALAQLTVNVNYVTELTSPDYPGVSGPVGTGLSFEANFANVNGTGIVGASLSCNWSGSYNVVESAQGIYDFDLDTTSIAIGEYPVLVTAVGPFVEPATMLIYAEVREVYNTISYSANELSIPVGENATFTITWTDTDHNQPVTGGVSYIACNWTPFHTTGEQNYSIVESSPGKYDVTIFTESDDSLTLPGDSITVRFSVERQSYQNHSFDIGVKIRSHNTLFVLDEPVQQTPYGLDIVVLVDYEDTDLGVGITNTSTLVHLTVTSPGVPSLQFSVAASSYGDGHYNITIPSGQWGTIGWKNLTIFIEWTGGVEKYYNQTIDTTVRVLGTDTDLYLELAPTATTYLDNFTFSAVYYDAINATRISNSSYDVILTITPITLGHPVTQIDFHVVESATTPGTYMFSLNTSYFQTTGAFQFELMFMWSAGVSPLYENRTMTVTLVVLTRPTYVDYSPVQSTPYGEIAEFTFSFVDSLSTSRVANSSQMTISLAEATVGYQLTYDSVERTFTMLIDTTTMTGTGVFTLHLNVTWNGEPFYQSVSSQEFSVTVTLRTSQLSHLAFAPGQWGNNVTIEFIYTDLVSGSPENMTGVLSLDVWMAGDYTVTSLGGGAYLLELNTSAFTGAGLYSINATIVYTGTNYAADAVESFAFAVLNRVTQIGYESPDPAPYLTNVTFTVSYSDDSTGVGIGGASITITCSNSTETLSENANFWIEYLGLGQYEIRVNTSELGAVGTFALNITISKSGEPYYLSATRLVNSRVTERTTQIVITKTPGEVPFNENVTLRFRFEDYLTKSNIAINKSHIILTHDVSTIVITDGEYALHSFGTYYEISFNSTILSPSSLVTAHPIQFQIDRSTGEPYYSVRSSNTSATTIERATQILFPLIEDTPYGDNVTIELKYVDYLSGNGIAGASIILSVQNLTTPTYYVSEPSPGEYIIEMPSTQFGSIGILLFNVTASKTGVPFYSGRITTGVPATIRNVQTSLIAVAPAAGAKPVGELQLVNLTLTDFDHALPVIGATITTSWNHSIVTLNELGNGLYQISINTTGIVAQEYSFTVQATMAFHTTANITVVIQPGPSTVEIVLEKTSYYSEWGDSLTIRFTVREPYYGTLVPDMTVTLLWNGSLIPGGDPGHNGTYVIYLETTDMNYGIFEPKLTVSKALYQTREKSFTLVVSKASGQFILQQSVFDVVIETTQQFWIYLNDTSRNLPVTSASVIAEWNNTPYSMTFNGTPGFYQVDVDVAGFPIGSYEITLIAVSNNFVILDSIIDINVVPIPASMGASGGLTVFTLYFGSTLDIIFTYNDSYYGGSVTGANVTYTIGNLTGSLAEQPNGTYTASMDTSSLAAGTLYLRLSASKLNYATITRSFLVTIIPLPTLVGVDATRQFAYPGETVSYFVNLTSTQTSDPVIGATLDIGWGGATFQEIGGGIYEVIVPLGNATPRTYDIQINLYRPNYEPASLRVNLDISRIETRISGIHFLDIAVNDTVTVPITVFNNITGMPTTNLVGIADWEDSGPMDLVLLGNGSYGIEIPDYLPKGTYHIDVRFFSAYYEEQSWSFNLLVRPVDTILIHGNTTVVSTPGAIIEIVITYWDVDHQIGIAGIEPIIDAGTGNISFIESLSSETEGVYSLYFQVNARAEFDLTITFERTDYESQVITYRIESDLSAEALATQALQIGLGSGMLFVAIFLFVYVKILSVPKEIRALNRMIKALTKGKIPKPYPTDQRGLIVLAIVNEALKPYDVKKVPDEVASEAVKVAILEVDDLLDRLVEITGLDSVEVDAFRADLATMKASERPGFLKEVIEQEEARRAEDIAMREEPSVPEKVPETLGESPEDIEDLRMKLEKKGMGKDEIDLILEQAKALSKADLEALLASLGIDLG